jgi:ribose transport system ATP-binding protein
MSPILELRAISKSFPGVQALREVSLSAHEGEVLALVGENGAGKSTLLKILGGVLSPDNGEIWVNQKQRRLTGPRDASALGIQLIHQELSLAEDLSVAENIFLGRQPRRGFRWLAITDRRTLHREAARILRLVGLDVLTGVAVGRLSIGQRQLVEIAKALSANARTLVLDEPTSSLSLNETNRLLSLIGQLRDQGTAIIYVTHRLNEVVRLANRVAVLRDGQHVGTLTGRDIAVQKMINLMVGRNIEQFYHKAEHPVTHGEPALEVSNLRYHAARRPMNFAIRKGEIVGFAGLVGAGRTELARAIFGIDRTDSGQIRVDGRNVRIRNPIDALSAGIALVPEDRKNLGVLAEMSICFNIALSSLPRLAKFGRYSRAAELDLSRNYQQLLKIRTPDLRRNVAELSGGNQQKVVLAKTLSTRPKVLILDEPTRGIDVSSKSEIYRLIFELAATGIAVMMISSEMEEIIGVSDRVIVMREGSIADELNGSQISEPAIMELAIGR